MLEFSLSLRRVHEPRARRLLPPPHRFQSVGTRSFALVWSQRAADLARTSARPELASDRPASRRSRHRRCGHRGEHKTYYFGTPGGGVWKTTNAGTTWFPIFDAARVASIGDLVVAPSNPNIIYVATGEQTNGNGVWKSTDAGATWSNIGFGDSPNHSLACWLIRTMQIWFTWLSRETTCPGCARNLSSPRTAAKPGGRSGSWTIAPVRWSSTSIPTMPIRSSQRRCVSHPGPVKSRSRAWIQSSPKSTDAGETWTPLGDQGLPPAHRMRTGLSIASGFGGKRIFALMAQGYSAPMMQARPGRKSRPTHAFSARITLVACSLTRKIQMLSM